ncbi:bifunctional helix-turn-helix transcriptional regulator/GNAT family N-acetyltransferase [Limnobaculum sp. M2-1]|uniref:bifunctional helix-turn-helix transcriptional regulator/GNAT family N-acetyltransferase n=1 Tax=Limnobaculum sp. M2-1 TaxID=2855838 RepID=UPI001C45B770|nr:bifunctional helix-turn-helix transcriptional regulator/GNAT family N-acetyltransferase [Limnobaculum sp. M2-1]MBV7693145.1 bifunctional helix-turn-helix transcriptional regulator/GNAT family N-acetyltransferase [Limnobaculum sp. M2-1]
MEPTSLRFLSRVLVRELGVMDKWVSGTQLSPLQAHSLIELDEHPLSGLELATVLKVDKSSVSRILQGLKQQGLIEIYPNPIDGRSTLNQLTKAGRKQLEQLNSLANAYNTKILQQLGSDEYQTLMSSMKKYVLAIQSVARQSSRTITIRPIEARDNAAIAEIIMSVFSEYGLLGQEGFSFSDPILHQLSDVYSQQGSAYWVVELDGMVSGGVGIAPMEEGYCELQKLYFLPSVRGMGIARRMVITALEFARQQGYDYCYLESTTTLKESLKLYESVGFEYVEERVGASGHHACEVLMVKKLG